MISAVAQYFYLLCIFEIEHSIKITGCYFLIFFCTHLTLEHSFAHDN